MNVQDGDGFAAAAHTYGVGWWKHGGVCLGVGVVLGAYLAVALRAKPASQ